MKKRFLSLCMAVAMLLSCLCITPAAAADAKFTKDYISGVLQAADLNAEVLMPGVTADDVYLSAKIPFAFDYAGKDAQVAPGSKWDAENLEHGTHVAGIAAGYAVDGEGAVTFSGVAPDAQVIPMKVFDDSGTGAATTTILAALEDAYRLGVDAVNLSLGSYGGFTVDEDALINDVYNKLDDAGIMVITAVGNETSSSYMNSYGTDAPLTGDPDNSVVAAPYDYKDGKCTVCGAADPDYRPEQPENPGQPEKPEQPENPGVKTGDSGVLLYMGLMLLALTGSAWVPWKKRAR